MNREQTLDFWRSRGVPEEAIEDLWTMAEAVRANEANTAEREDVKSVVAASGWHTDALQYLATQRALRMHLMMVGAPRELLDTIDSVSAIAVVGEVGDKALLAALQTIWIDGFATAAKAAQIRKADE